VELEQTKAILLNCMSLTYAEMQSESLRERHKQTKRRKREVNLINARKRESLRERVGAKKERMRVQEWREMGANQETSDRETETERRNSVLCLLCRSVRLSNTTLSFVSLRRKREQKQ
jgi:hypothetical protein